MASLSKQDSEGLSKYLKSLGSRTQLTREQEYDLSRRVKRGDEGARRILAESNLPFVIAVARKFADLGFAIYGTRGTANALRAVGLECKTVFKVTKAGRTWSI